MRRSNKKGGLKIIKDTEFSDREDEEERVSQKTKQSLDNSPDAIRKRPGLREGFNLESNDQEEYSLFEINSQSHTILRYDKDSIKSIYEGRKLRRLDRILTNSETFRDAIQESQDFKLEDYFMSIKSLKNDWNRLSQLILRQKKLVNACHQISKDHGLSEAMNKIVEEVCEVLECDRASVFMLDELNGQLWTKAAKKSETIRIPMNAGIVGHVVTKNETLNIEDAYQCDFFNKDVDKQTNYRTKSILCCPILDQYGNVIGACEAINKLTKHKFEADDLEIFEHFTTNAGIILRKSMQFDESVVLQHHFKCLILDGTSFLTSRTIDDFMIKAEDVLCKRLEIAECRIYLRDFKCRTIY